MLVNNTNEHEEVAAQQTPMPGGPEQGANGD